MLNSTLAKPIVSKSENKFALTKASDEFDAFYSLTLALYFCITFLTQYMFLGILFVFFKKNVDALFWCWRFNLEPQINEAKPQGKNVHKNSEPFVSCFRPTNF